MNVEVKEYKVEQDDLGRAYATGKRKDSTAKVWVKAGKGDIKVNGKDFKEYFGRNVLQMIVVQPFGIITGTEPGKELNITYDVVCDVSGGGLSGQAGAIKHGISKALVNFEPTTRTSLKKSGFLTRDSRVVERKKYGKRKARRSSQFSKR